MKFKTLINTSWLAALLITAGSALLASPAFAEDDCQYVPRTQSGVDMPDSDKIGTAYVHQVHVVGCRVQCIARVFCRSENLALTGPLSKQVMFDHAKPLNCDANPPAQSYGKDIAVSCPTADECAAGARGDPTRIAVPTSPNPGADSFKENRATFHAQYGLDRSVLEPKIPMYSFPPLKGNEPEDYRICASPVTVVEKGMSQVACPANTEEPLGCRNANDCAGYKDEDPTAPVIAIYPAGADQRVHYTPPSTSPRKVPAATIARPGDKQP